MNVLGCHVAGITRNGQYSFWSAPIWTDTIPIWTGTMFLGMVSVQIGAGNRVNILTKTRFIFA
jgi:hypothetical protein